MKEVESFHCPRYHRILERLYGFTECRSGGSFSNAAKTEKKIARFMDGGNGEGVSRS